MYLLKLFLHASDKLQSEVFLHRHNFFDEADAIEFYEQAQRNPGMKLTDCMQKQAIELLDFKILG